VFRAGLNTGMGAADTQLEATRYLWRRMRTESKSWPRISLRVEAVRNMLHGVVPGPKAKEKSVVPTLTPARRLRSESFDVLFSKIPRSSTMDDRHDRG
jgi:hypothetical protein